MLPIFSLTQFKREYSQIIHLVRTSVQYYQNSGLIGIPLNFEEDQPTSSSFASLDELTSYLGRCRRCLISLHRSLAVAGEGDRASSLVFVARSPGVAEVACRKPLQGEEGELFDRLLSALKLSRERIYLTYAVKCPLPKADGPIRAQASFRCRRILLQELQLLERPRVICTLDNLDALATQTVLGRPMGSVCDLRGKLFSLWVGERQTRVIPTYSPGFILQTTEEREIREKKKLVWQDMQLISKELSE